ncbi:MAG: YrdB family protein [Flavobacteriales bacterium]|nr:YrdB family protein [Flavobacteriales bacterium]
MNWGNHPINLALRFLLEICALLAVGYWAYLWQDSNLRYVFMILFPCILAAVWGIFAVPGDPSRSGKTVVKTPGWIRLILELIIFSLGILALYQTHLITAASLLCGWTLLHYLLSVDRINWLMKH